MLEVIIYAFLFGTNSLSTKFLNKIGLLLPHYTHGCWKFQISSWIAILKEMLQNARWSLPYYSVMSIFCTTSLVVCPLDFHFLDLFGDAQSIKKADDRHAKLLFLPNKSIAESRKRYAEDYLFLEKTKLVKSVISPSAPSVIGAYTSTPNQWAAGYGLQPQAWPQTSQAQAQQWTSGYPQQGAYGTSFAHPQLPTSQNAAYGTYPPTYPTQTYAQLATTATLTGAQHPAAAPPTYYSTYY